MSKVVKKKDLRLSSDPNVEKLKNACEAQISELNDGFKKK